MPFGISKKVVGDKKNMTEIDQVYRCSVCGNAVKIIEAGAGQLVCCGEPMEIVEEEPEEEQL